MVAQGGFEPKHLLKLIAYLSIGLTIVVLAAIGTWQLWLKLFKFACSYE